MKNVKKHGLRLVSVLLAVLMLSAVMITPLSVSAANTDKVETGTKTDYWDVSAYGGAASDFTYEICGTYDDQVQITGYRSSFPLVNIPSEIEGKPVAKIERGAFKNSAVTRVIIPSSVWYIGYGAFEGCSKLKEIFIPESVTFIQKDVFLNCGNSLLIYSTPSSEIQTYAKRYNITCNVNTTNYFYRYIKAGENKLELVGYLGTPEGTAKNLFVP